MIATGEQHSVREFVERGFRAVGMRIEWRGIGRDERRRGRHRAQPCRVDPRYFRPTEVDTLLGDAKARGKLGWKPRWVRHPVQEMVESDLGCPSRCAGGARGLQDLSAPGVTRRRGARSRNKKSPDRSGPFLRCWVLTNDRRRRRRNCRGSRHRRRRRLSDRRRCGACPELRSHAAHDHPSPCR